LSSMWQRFTNVLAKCFGKQFQMIEVIAFVLRNVYSRENCARLALCMVLSLYSC